MKTKKRVKALEQQIHILTYILAGLAKAEARRMLREIAAGKPAKPAEPEAPHEAP
jgi:hypothetical protein